MRRPCCKQTASTAVNGSVHAIAPLPERPQQGLDVALLRGRSARNESSTHEEDAMRARGSVIAYATIAAVTVVIGMSVVHAQPAPAVKRTVLQKQGLRAHGQEGVMALVEIPAGAREGRHTHPAEAFVYVMDGTLTFDVEGKPEKTYQAGDSFFIEPGKVHEGINNGNSTVRAVAVFVTDKDKPLTTQAK
jgi:quercetin dioxygenase-like cupin family protein